MICCKIITDYNNIHGNFNQLLKDLTSCGDFLWENNSLYFSNTYEYEVNKKTLIQILKKNGYDDFFINIYSKNNEPNENENINGWIYDKLIKINYKCYEHESQELFKNISKGLDMLDEEIADIKRKTNKYKEKNINEEAEPNG